MNKRIAIGLPTLLFLDLIWILSNQKMYGRLVQKIQGKPMKINKFAAVLAYLIIAIAFLFLVLRNLERDNNKSSNLVLSLKHGALFGFVVYGIFNATNLAMFSDYSWKVALIDTMWGTFVYWFVVLLVLQVAP